MLCATASHAACKSGLLMARLILGLEEAQEWLCGVLGGQERDTLERGRTAKAAVAPKAPNEE